jgi:hypothetical protein
MRGETRGGYRKGERDGEKESIRGIERDREVLMKDGR